MTTTRTAFACLLAALCGAVAQPAAGQGLRPSATEVPTTEPTARPTAEPTEEPTAVPTEKPTEEPTEEPTAPSGARIVQVGPVFRDADVTQLLIELRLAGDTPVILLVPGTAKAELSDAALNALGAPRDATLILVQEGNGGSGGATATLAQYADHRYLQPGASPPAGSDGASWQPVADALHTLGLSGDALTVQSGAVESLGDALLTPAPAPPESTARPTGRGGPGLLLMLLLGALVIAGLAAALMLMRPRPRVAGTRRQEPLPRPVEPARTPRTTPPTKPRPTGATRRATPAPATAPPRRSGRGHPAEVVSVIDPEGYVELEGCLRRVLWGTPGDAPAAPGDRVEVEQHAGRLWAFPAHRSAQPTAGHSASNTNGAAG